MPVAEDKFYRAKITHRVDHSEDLWSIRLNPGGPFHFKPGQYATLGIATADKHIERPYSIVSAPYEKELEFFIELVPGGALTPLLHQLKEGDEVTMRKAAKGRFTLDTGLGRTNHLLICTVTGIAPFVSYVRQLLRDAEEGRFAGEHRLYLMEGASRSWEFGYAEEMRQAAAKAPWLQFVATVSRPWEDPKWQGEVGRVDELIRKYADGWGLDGTNTIAYLCGHPQMIEHGKGILKRRGFPKEAIKEELFWVPVKRA